jgi:hypothetical protein
VVDFDDDIRAALDWLEADDRVANLGPRATGQDVPVLRERVKLASVARESGIESERTADADPQHKHGRAGACGAAG